MGHYLAINPRDQEESEDRETESMNIIAIIVRAADSYNA